MESVFYMVQSMSLLAREKVERQIKDEEAAELERLQKSKEGEDGSVPVEENEEEPTEEEIAAKRAEEAEKLRQKTQLIKDNDIIPEGAYLWESIYPKAASRGAKAWIPLAHTGAAMPTCCGTAQSGRA